MNNKAQRDNIVVLKDAYIEYYKEIPIQRLAAGSIGRSEDTIINWRKSDAEFSERVEKAEAEFARLNMRKIRSSEWKLERVLKHTFAQRSELTGKEGKDLPVPILQINPNVSGNNSNTEDQPTN